MDAPPCVHRWGLHRSRLVKVPTRASTVGPGSLTRCDAADARPFAVASRAEPPTPGRTAAGRVPVCPPGVRGVGTQKGTASPSG